MKNNPIANKKQLFKNVEELFIAKIIAFAKAEAYPKTINEAFNYLFYPDSIFIDIEGLGINNGNLELATRFVFEKYKHQHEYSDECFNFYRFRVEETLTLYPNLVELYSHFFQLTQLSDDYDDIYNQTNEFLCKLNEK